MLFLKRLLQLQKRFLQSNEAIFDMLLTMRYFGDPILRQKAKPIEIFDVALKEFANAMIKTMDEQNGIGLAAPQVGHSVRLFVTRDYMEDGENKPILGKPTIYINPRLRSPDLELCSDTEGCLSIPGVRCEVIRPISIVIEAFDVEGKPFTEKLSGYNARVRMHENDHLNGVLFVDRIDAKEKRRVAPFLRSLEKRSTKDS
jgi:peptide deformylase